MANVHFFSYMAKKNVHKIVHSYCHGLIIYLPLFLNSGFERISANLSKLQISQTIELTSIFLLLIKSKARC